MNVATTKVADLPWSAVKTVGLATSGEPTVTIALEVRDRGVPFGLAMVTTKEPDSSRE